MLQFYVLSVLVNLLAGLTLCSDWIALRFPGISALADVFSRRRGKLAIGLGALLVGFATLFVPAGPPLVIGDLYPSLMGMAMGIALLFEMFKQDALLPGEGGERRDPAERPVFGYRTTLGILGLAAAVLHFFLPERLIV
jgi:hypothetical protein